MFFRVETLLGTLIYLALGYLMGAWLSEHMFADLTQTHWHTVWPYVWMIFWPFFLIIKFIELIFLVLVGLAVMFILFVVAAKIFVWSVTYRERGDHYKDVK